MQPSTREMKRPIMRFTMVSGSMTTICMLPFTAVAKEAAGKGVAQTFLQGLIEGEKGPDFRCDTHPDNLVMQHLLEKLGYHYCGKVPIDGVRLAYQKIKRKAETSLFQVVSEEDRWDQRAEAAYNDTLS